MRERWSTRNGTSEAARAKGLDPRALAVAVLAAIEALLDRWAAGELDTDVDGLIEHAVVIVTGTVDRLEQS